MNQHASALIEFFGMPGVGKSTISNEIAKVISQKGISVEQRMYLLSHRASRTKRIIIKLFYVLKESFFNLKYTVFSAKVILATKQKSNLDLLKVVFNWLFVSALLRQSRRLDRICLFDEGIFQAMWSIVFSADEPNALVSLAKQLNNFIPLPNIVIVIEAALPNLKDRLSIRLRHDSRIEKIATDDSEALFERSLLLFESVKSILKNLSERYQGIHILMLKNEQSGDMQINLVKIIKTIESVLTETSFTKASSISS